MGRLNIRIENIYKEYNNVPVLKDINFSIQEKEIVCILGPSGSGKSTILNIIAGINTQSSGEIFVDNIPFSSTPHFKRDFGVVFQGLNLFPHLNVYNNIAFSLKTKRHRKTKEFIKQRVEFLLQQFSLSGLGHRKPHDLSGGERQRIAIARAIAFEPKVLLLDEPFSSLDKLLKDHLLNELKLLQLRLGISILYITHDQSEAARLSDKIIILNKGCIQQQGTFKNLYLNPANLFVHSFIGETNTSDCILLKEESGLGVVEIAGGVSLKTKIIHSDQLENKMQICVRPEDIMLIKDVPNPENNTINGKITKCSKFEIRYKIQIEIPGPRLWVFFNDTDDFQEGQEIKIHFKIEKTFLYIN